MIRYIVFALLGPIAVFVLVATYWGTYDQTGLTAVVAFYLTIPISVIAGIFDGCLALLMSKLLKARLTTAAGAIFLRAPLTAAVGAIVVHGPLAYQLDGSQVRYWTTAAATYAGICSLLSINWLAMGRRIEEWAARD